jgi:hypothetical protein
MYTVVAYCPRDSKLYADLEDFRIGMHFTELEMQNGLELGHLTPGLVVMKPAGSLPAVVVGSYQHRQHLVPLWQYVKAIWAGG